MKAATLRTTALRSVGTNTKDPDLIRDRREQLIRAALAVFQEKGFHATTVRDIGRVAGELRARGERQAAVHPPRYVSIAP